MSDQPWYQHVEQRWVQALCAVEARWLHIGLMHRLHQSVVQIGPLSLKGFAGLHALPWLHLTSFDAKGDVLPDCYVNPSALPLADDAVSAVVVWHVHDWFSEPEAVWQEALRVLEPGGDLLLMGFQTPSVLSYQKTWQMHHRLRPHARVTLDRWLACAPLQALSEVSFGFEPWSVRMRQAPHAFDAMGHLFWPTMGSVYCRVYRKCKRPLTPVGLTRSVRCSTSV